MSSNFGFIYRELHQSIQILLIVVFFMNVLRYRRLHGVNKIIAGFLFFVLISLVSAPFDDDMRKQLINLVASICTVNFLFLATKNKTDLNLIVNFIGKLAVLLAALGLLEALSGFGGRISVTFSNPNYYGLFLGVGSCAILSNWNGYKRNLSFFLVLVAIILSGSRSAVAFPVIQILWSTYSSGRLLRLVPIVATLLLSAFIVLNFSSTRFTDSQRLVSSDAERVFFAKVALRMADENPFSGVGWGRFISEFENFSSIAERNLNIRVYYERSERRRRVTHNDYVRILAELGWLAFVAAVVCSLVGLLVLYRRRSFDVPYLLPAYFGMILYSLGHNNMNSAFFWYFFLLPFYLNMQLDKDKPWVGNDIRIVKPNKVVN